MYKKYFRNNGLVMKNILSITLCVQCIDISSEYEIYNASRNITLNIMFIHRNNSFMRILVF